MVFDLDTRARDCGATRDRRARRTPLTTARSPKRWSAPRPSRELPDPRAPDHGDRRAACSSASPRSSRSTVRAAKPEPPIPVVMDGASVEVTLRVAPTSEQDPAAGVRFTSAEQRQAWLGLGSNIGDTFRHLRSAIERLREQGLLVEEVSSVWRDRSRSARSSTSPTSSTPRSGSAPTSSPEELLDTLKAGRTGAGTRRWPRRATRPRLIDVDLLLLGDLELRDPIG